ncbi:hypothetical protein PDJAM_G00040710, partial [Pangasius djambal]|nr:hypothetical protein [Pangasius djambal]
GGRGSEENGGIPNPRLEEVGNTTDVSEDEGFLSDSCLALLLISRFPLLIVSEVSPELLLPSLSFFSSSS